MARCRQAGGAELVPMFLRAGTKARSALICQGALSGTGLLPVLPKTPLRMRAGRLVTDNVDELAERWLQP